MNESLPETLKGFIPISLSDLRPDDILSFDVYLFMERNQKLILYRKKNQEFEETKLKYFEKMKIKTFFIKEEDRELYQKYLSQAFTGILTNEDMPEEEKQESLKKASKKVLDDLFNKDEGENEGIDSNVQAIVKEIVTSVSKEIKMGEVYEKLTAMITDEDNTFSHSLNVSSYSVLFAFALGVVSSTDISNIGIAGVLHDIYLASLPTDLVERYRNGDELNTAEMLKIRRHPHGAEEIIRKRYKNFNEQIIWIIRQHHEQPDGLGYPLGLKSENISYLAKILSIANTFDNTVYIYKRKGTPPTPPEIFDLMKQKWKQENQIFDMDIFDELMKVIFNWG